jgi:hypothetical protein
MGAIHEETANRSPIPGGHQGLEIGQQTIDIARGVLVDGRPQAEFVTRWG